jgi:hypothetical protein
VRSRGAEGNIEIELKFREHDTAPLVTYFLEIGENNGRPIVEREILISIVPFSFIGSFFSTFQLLKCIFSLQKFA